MELKEITFLPTKENVKLLGRSIMLDDCRLLALSGSGVEFTYTGTKLVVSFYGDSSVCIPEGEPEHWGDYARVCVIVDGVRYLDTVVCKPKQTYNVCFADPGAEVAEHTVRILKLSEPRMSSVGLGEIKIMSTNGPAPTPDKKTLIEFVGDSITCGYGVDTPSELYHFTTATEDVTKAFAYKTAENLDVDFSMVSYSGHGLISGYTSDPSTPKIEELVQPYYEIFAYSYNNFRGMEIQSNKWKAEREPDIVVINLGTNDESYCGKDSDKRAAFEEDYYEFLEQIHEVHPDAYIVSAFGLMGDLMYECEENAIAKFKADYGFDKIGICHIAPQNPAENGLVADYHPSAKSHTLAAETVTEFIKNNILK